MILILLRIILMRPLRRASVALGLAALLGTPTLSGCAALTGDDLAGTQVAAAFYPLRYVAQRVAGEHAAVADLTQPGKEPHDLELTIKETALVANADLLLHEPGFQPAVDDAIEQNATGEVIDAAAVAGLRSFADGSPDPHFWQDPIRMAALGDEVAARLSALDPSHAEYFAASAADLRADLESLDDAYARGLADCRRSTVVVSHDAFGYLAKYGLEIEPIAGLSPDAEPTPADLGRLQGLIAADGLTTVFSERLVSPRLAQSLAGDLGIGTAVLDPVEGLSSESADDDYLSLMRANLAALQSANGCR